MRICFAMDFHYSERIGGAEVQAWLLARELARRGHEVHYLAQSLQGKANEMEVRELWRNGLEYYRTLRRLAPDMIIQRMTSFNTGVTGLYARRHHKPFAWICTDNGIPERWLFTRKEWHAARQKGLSGKLKSPILLLNAVINDLARDWGMRQATHVFTQNEEQFDKLLSNYGLTSLHMPSGHELPRAGIAPPARFHHKIILWVGNLGANKRPEKFIQLAKLVQKREWKFVIVGGKEGVSSFEESFGETRLDNLHWLGKLTFNETLLWFDQATIFVNTSKIEGEGFPNTFIQSWLRGVPVVTLGVDPNQFITKNDLGRVGKDVQTMVDALHELLGDEADYCRMSERIAAFAARQFTIATVADQFLQAIHASKTAVQSRLADTHSQLACAS
ncbi:glycosyltransferase family 4 protein [candidate division KSB1 bacterium]|nr:glycosyltransferase family 4 protein [candidate division KSB1 bacterium]